MRNGRTKQRVMKRTMNSRREKKSNGREKGE
jgi:hypothetical protein